MSVLAGNRALTRTCVAMIVLIATSVLSACSTDGGPSSSAGGAGTSEVGVDIRPGVYTSGGTNCVGFVASERNYDPRTSDDLTVPHSVRVGQSQRVEVHNGEFLVSRQCRAWHRMARKDDSPDPATLAGGCEILLGKGRLVTQSLAIRTLPGATPGPEQKIVGDLQEQLVAFVVTRNKELMDPAVALIGFLDDPPTHLVDGKLDSKTTQSVAKIHHACAAIAGQSSGD
jgi:hypothetical protein